MSLRRQAVRLAVLLAACYLAVVGLFTLLEGTLLFPAPRVSRAELALWARQFGATEVSLQSADGESLYGWRLGSSDRIVVYFSGNGSTVAGAAKHSDARGRSRARALRQVQVV